MKLIRPASYLVILLAGALFFACGNHDLAPLTGIFVSGTVDGFPVYWKDGIRVQLAKKEEDARAQGIFVSGNDIYVVGQMYVDGKTVATLWKNGTATHLTTVESSHANSVFVKGTDVYVAGTINGVATYWKNGEPVILTPGTNRVQNDQTGSIYVYGNDIYVAGYATVPTGYVSAAYWKNGVPVFLNSSKRSHTTSIFVMNGDVYVTGSSDESITQTGYWLNGEFVRVPNSSELSSIFVDSDHVYVAGYSNNDDATFWKDGAMYFALNDPATSLRAATTSVNVSKGIIYVAGSLGPGAIYWKNGEQRPLIGNGIATGIFVVE